MSSDIAIYQPIGESLGQGSADGEKDARKNKFLAHLKEFYNQALTAYKGSSWQA